MAWLALCVLTILFRALRTLAIRALGFVIDTRYVFMCQFLFVILFSQARSIFVNGALRFCDCHVLVWGRLHSYVSARETGCLSVNQSFLSISISNLLRFGIVRGGAFLSTNGLLGAIQDCRTAFWHE